MSAPESGDDLLTVKQALEILGFSRMTLERRMRAGYIHPVNINPALLRPKELLFRRADVERLARGEMPPAEG